MRLNSEKLFENISFKAVNVFMNVFFFLKSNFYKGAAIPFVLIGLLLGIVGYTVYNRSDADRTRNVYAYDMNPSQLKNKELMRVLEHLE